MFVVRRPFQLHSLRRSASRVRQLEFDSSDPRLRIPCLGSTGDDFIEMTEVFLDIFGAHLTDTENDFVMKLFGFVGQVFCLGCLSHIWKRRDCFAGGGTRLVPDALVENSNGVTPSDAYRESGVRCLWVQVWISSTTPRTP